MVKIGMIGGLGPQSTLDYYRLLIETHSHEAGDGSNPEIIIYSMDMNSVLDLVAQEQWDALVDLLLDGIEVLQRAGADFGFISANTPHMVFDRVSELSPIPLLSIVEETCRHIRRSGLRKVGLLGTKFTMSSDFYQKACRKDGVQLFVPDEDEQDYIHDKLMTEIELGVFLDETRNGLLGIVRRMIEEDSIEGIILGCTELPLILTKDELGIPFLNTTQIHVEGIIRHYLQMRKGLTS